MSTFGLTKGQYDIITSILSKYKQIKKVKIYGSRAKGNFSAGSDIDLVITEGINDRHITGLIILDINNSDFPYTVDLQNINNIKNQQLLDHIQRIGKLFYERNTLNEKDFHT